MANLKLDTVSKIYPSGALALYKINLELPDSQFIAVVGGEKSGKTSLLRVIAGIEDVTEGTVTIGDKDVTGADARDRDVAMIFQGDTLYPSINVYENIAFPLKLRKANSSLIEQRVKVVAEMLNLSDVLGRKPKALTTEQKQKTAFARAIAREPKLYLLDDPLAGLNGELKAKLRSILINLQLRMNGTFIYATKNVNEALTMATRILVLRDGMVQQIDTPSNLYDYPVNTYVAFLIGSPTTNFINNASIVKEDGTYYAAYEGVKLALPENIVSRFTAIDDYADSDKKVIVGVRPEDMCFGEGGIEAEVEACEEICGKSYSDCRAGKLSFVVKGKAEKGEKVALCADMTRAFVFDAVTRLTLLSRDGGYVQTGFADADKIPLGYDEEEAIKNKLKPSKVDKKKKRQ